MKKIIYNYNYRTKNNNNRNNINKYFNYYYLQVMETTFNFSNDNTEYIYALHPKSEIILHIKRETNSSACLYFTNQLNTSIHIPPDFIIYKNNKILYPKNNQYILFWNKNYDIVYNGETLQNIRNEKTWTIYN